jgi:transcriptional regulator with XRE-family HTH domain
MPRPGAISGVPDLEHVPGESKSDNERLANLGRNLRRFRTKRGYSLERFSKICGVSRGMLGQIETGKSMPTIGVLWKIATALDVPFAQLLSEQDGRGTFVLRRSEAALIASEQGAFQSRILSPLDSGGRVEFYEIRLAPSHKHHSDAHAMGTRENLVVTSGIVEVALGTAYTVQLSKGDEISFEADLPHTYENLSDIEAVFLLVMTYDTARTNFSNGQL